MHKIMKIISAASLALIYSIGAVSALSKVKESKVVEAADTDRTVYCLVPSSTTSALNAYSWNSNSSEKNADWPGVSMTKGDSIGDYNVFSITIENANFNKIIFNYNNGIAQTANLDLTSSNLLWTAYWKKVSENNWNFVADNYKFSNESSLKKFKLVGHHTNWADNVSTAPSFTLNSDSTSEEYVISNIDLTKESNSSTVTSGFKTVLVDDDNNIVLWLGNGSNWDSNATISEDGRYNVYFRPQTHSLWQQNHLYFELNNSYTLTLHHKDGSADTSYTLVKNTSVTDKVEYMTSENLDVKKGDTLELKKNDVVTTSFIPTSSGKNNYSSSGFLFDASGIIYVDETNSKIFAGGLESDFGMLINDKFVALIENTETSSEYFVTDYSFVKDDVIKFVNTTTTTPTTFVNSVLDDHGFNSYFTLLAADDGIKVNDDVTASLYLKLGSPNNTVYFTSSAYDEAITFAQAFEAKFGFSSTASGVCNHDGSTAISDVQTAWKQMSEKYTTDVTNETAKKILKGEIASSHSAIVTFAQGYDYIYGKYSSELGEYGGDFASRNPTPLTNTSYPRVVNLTSENNIAIVVFILIGSVSLIAAGSFFVIRKNKRQ